VTWDLIAPGGTYMLVITLRNKGKVICAPMALFFFFRKEEANGADF
jgi:hypothetical protein